MGRREEQELAGRWGAEGWGGGELWGGRGWNTYTLGLYKGHRLLLVVEREWVHL